MRSKIVIQKPTATGLGLIGVDSLLDVYASTQSGDLVIVYPGTYNLGDNSIQLRNGVNWKFMPGVTITSDSTGGTFKDGGTTVITKFEGDPTIENTNGISKFIVKTTGTKIYGYVRRYRALLNPDITAPFGDFVFQVIELENSLGGDVVWTRSQNGIYVGTLSGAFSTKTFINFSNGDNDDGIAQHYRLLCLRSIGTSAITFTVYDKNGSLSPYSESANMITLPNISIEVLVYYV
jgi:hypothetical protein